MKSKLVRFLTFLLLLTTLVVLPLPIISFPQTLLYIPPQLPPNPWGVLGPYVKMLKFYGIPFEQSYPIAFDADKYGVGGLCHSVNGTITLSIHPNYPGPLQNFVLAHELEHAFEARIKREYHSFYSEPEATVMAFYSLHEIGEDEAIYSTIYYGKGDSCLFPFHYMLLYAFYTGDWETFRYYLLINYLNSQEPEVNIKRG